MRVTSDSQPNSRAVKAHVLADVLLLVALLVCMAVWGLNVKLAAGILAISVVITLGTYQAYRNRPPDQDSLPKA